MYCGCEDCSFYVVSSSCPECEACETCSVSDYISIIAGSAAGSIFLGLILGYCIRSCLIPKKGDKVQPVLGDGDTVRSIHDEYGKEDGTRSADPVSQKQKETMKSITNAMTPTRKLSGVVRMRRVVREKLLSLQGHEKEKVRRREGAST